MPPESPNPLSYMSPLWGALLVILVVVVILYLIAKPLHRYITDRKTYRLIEESGAETDALPAKVAAITSDGGDKEAEGGSEPPRQPV